ncbi:hypothetical protein ACFW9F_27690 [Streptomyces sp. NPDC059506]|uniref:hypothetical protein n=1 Tax=Streptomyces sp. NPDC059506 TaxID=3347751 RepID=UPI00369ABEAB
MDWIHGRAAESAEQLHPACGRAVRAWREDADECAEAVRRLRGGGEYRFALGDDGVLYVVAARPVHVPPSARPAGGAAPAGAGSAAAPGTAGGRRDSWRRRNPG